LYSIDEDFLIESIQITPADSKYLEYSIKCLNGVSIGGWTNFFKKILQKQNDFEIGSDETIVKIHSDTEDYNMQCITTITASNCLYPSNTLYPSDILTPGTLKGSVITLND